MEKEVLNKVEKIICLSEDTFSLISEDYFINKDKISIIPNGLRKKQEITFKKKQEIRTKYGFCNDEKVLLFVGRISLMKGIIPLILAFKKVLQKEPNCHLIIVGDGHFNYAMNASKEIWNKVHFLGRLRPEELTDMYELADIGILPSYSEQCSYVGIEMMMYGLPTVASDAYGVRSMFRHNDNAIIASIENYNKTKNYEKNLENAILSLLSSDILNAKMARKSKLTYKKTYMLKKMELAYEALLLECINKNNVIL